MGDVGNGSAGGGRSSWLAVAVAWTLVGLPLAWGIYKTLEKALVLFR
jgi:hypothetical protein